MTTELPSKPNDRLTITVNNQPLEIFMSAGLIRLIAPIYSGGLNVDEIFQDPEVQNEIILLAVQPRGKRGQTPDKYDSIEDVEMSLEDGFKLVGWVTEHVFHFFIESATTARELGHRATPHMERFLKSLESPTGQQNSQPLNSSAGASE